MYKMSKTEKCRLYFQFMIWSPIRDWFLRIYYCHHNARVILDFEDRMTSVIYEATGGLMSKPYYCKDVMLSQINDYNEQRYEEGYKDAKEECESCKE